ncbi:MAG: transcriptional regulator [Candidatus Nanohalobium sp.]
MSKNEIESIPYGKDLLIKESQGLEEALERTEENLEDAIDGEKNPVVVGFSDPERIRELLTPKRRELMQAVIQSEPESISELSETLGRDLKSVHRDLETLGENKIIYFEKENGRKRPVIPFDSIKVEYDLKSSLMDQKTGIYPEKA